jgi:uncharacterized tellurite resistance protein B-like protein
MSLNLTSLEKMAVTRVLVDIANADGEVSKHEVAYMMQLQSVLGITNDELVRSKRMGVTESLAVLKAMLPHEKALLGYMMHQMIHADGSVDEEEKKIFVFVCLMAEIPLPS